MFNYLLKSRTHKEQDKISSPHQQNSENKSLNLLLKCAASSFSCIRLTRLEENFANKLHHNFHIKAHTEKTTRRQLCEFVPITMLSNVKVFLLNGKKNEGDVRRLRRRIVWTKRYALNILSTKILNWLHTKLVVPRNLQEIVGIHSNNHIFCLFVNKTQVEEWQSTLNSGRAVMWC